MQELACIAKLVITGRKKPEHPVNAVDRLVKELKILSLL